MCGIICYIGQNAAFNIILEAIKNLLNRGYDSVGIATFNHNKTYLSKYSSTQHNDIIECLVNAEHKDTYYGIGHTRWATHGGISDINSHPHHDSYNNIYVVHNGIIDNYSALKDFLIDCDYNFYSETDTEVIANLVSYNYKIDNDIDTAIYNTMKLLQGIYAVCLVCKDYPDTIYTFCKSMPLLVGFSDNSIIVTSEQSGFSNNIDYFSEHPDNTVLTIKKQNSKYICNYAFNKLHTFTFYENKKTNYKYWIEKEINEQHIVAKNVLDGRIYDNKVVIDNDIVFLKNVDNVILMGCGTSSHACQLSKYFFKDLCPDVIVTCIDGSDFELSCLPNKGVTCVVFVTQSGETRDLYKALEMIKNDPELKHIYTIGVVNVENSLIARRVDHCLYLKSGKEVSVASTKVFTSSCLCLCYIAIVISTLNNYNNKSVVNEYIMDIVELPNKINYLLKNITINDDVVNLLLRNSMFVLGKHQGEIIAKEAALKIKEISYIHAEAYSVSCLKHGPFGLLAADFPVIIIDIDKKYSCEIYNVKKEILARDSNVIKISNDINDDICIPHSKYFNSVLAVIPMQILAFKLSLHKGINPDYPRNLAKVVTV